MACRHDRDAARGCSGSCWPADGDRGGAVIEMELVGVRVELPSNAPIVLLREVADEGRFLPIFIGGAEATAIALALEEVDTPRPMTHDLMKNVLDELGYRLERVTVTELRDKTFFAELELSGAEDQHSLSSRPSDAIALAVRTGTPIFASELVLDQAGYRASDDDTLESVDEDAVVEEFREFIDSIKPEDFES